MHIALFITCFNDTMFPRTGRAVTELLERLGHTVEFPQGQTCCGQMHFSTGYRPETLPMVRRFAEVFAGYDAVVAPRVLRGHGARPPPRGGRPVRRRRPRRVGRAGGADGVRAVGTPRLLSREGRIGALPGPFARWSGTRDTPAPARESLRAWWRRTRPPRSGDSRTTAEGQARR